ncbi:hypothetical protein Hanom_Chr11g01047491 [Helianthus anomalus]
MAWQQLKKPNRTQLDDMMHKGDFSMANKSDFSMANKKTNTTFKHSRNNIILL